MIENQHNHETKWLVVEYSYDYNDEFYYQPEGEPYFAKRLFSTKEEAKEAAKDLTIKKVRESSKYIFVKGAGKFISGPQFFEFTYTGEDDHDMDLNLYIKQIGGEVRGENVFDCQLPPNATDEQILKALEIASYYFYEVISVEED